MMNTPDNPLRTGDRDYMPARPRQHDSDSRPDWQRDDETFAPCTDAELAEFHRGMQEKAEANRRALDVHLQQLHAGLRRAYSSKTNSP